MKYYFFSAQGVPSSDNFLLPILAILFLRQPISDRQKGAFEQCRIPK